MATTNLNTRSLGDIQLQSGNGSPNHAASGGAMYIDIDSHNLYLKKEGYTGATISSDFNDVEVISSAAIYLSANTLNIVTGTANTWLPITGSTYVWTIDNLNGFSHSNGYLTLTANTPGRFFVNMAYTAKYVSTFSTFEAGISKNSVVPAIGYYSTNCLNAASGVRQTINAFGYVDLVTGNTISVSFRCPLAATTTTQCHSLFLSIKKMNG